MFSICTDLKNTERVIRICFGTHALVGKEVTADFFEIKLEQGFNTLFKRPADDANARVHNCSNGAGNKHDK